MVAGMILDYINFN